MCASKETGPAVIAVDPDIADDSTSDYDSSSFQSADSQSITSTVLDYVFENGRRYHRLAEGKYLLPNDETEQDRLDLMQEIFLLLLDGKLFCAPIGDDPHRILDLGTGTGIFALDVAETYPSAEVTGTDLSAIQPAWVWPNCKFEIDDMEEPWTWPRSHFDYIHMRTVSNIRDWPNLASQMYAHTRPGGYVEIVDWEGDMHSDDASIPTESMLRRVLTLYRSGLANIGVPFVTDTGLKTSLEEAGFEDVVVETHKAPISPWAADKRLKNVGLYVMSALETGWEAYLLAVLTRGHGFSQEEAKMMCSACMADTRNKKIHAYQKVWHVYGRKPDGRKNEVVN